MSARPGDLLPDRAQLAEFASLLFRNARSEGFIALRSFVEGSKDQGAILMEWIRIGDPDLLNIIVERARQAATWNKPAVFCPPVATFRTDRNAKTKNLYDGVALSVECDQRPLEARQTLEALLGNSTIVVASGGEWTKPETGEIDPRLHLHWRLSKPTATPEEHDMLKEARRLATELVGGDGTNISIVHPIRWPGSWHRKGTPRLAKIVASFDNEIDLAEAVERLRDASGAATFAGFGFKTDSKFRASNPEAVASALSVIPNDNLAWNDWNRIGMATWAATDGSEVGREAFVTWSAKASKNDKNTTEARWQHYKTSPPTKIGFGTLVYHARKHSPGWSYGSDLRADDFYAYMPEHKYLFAPSATVWPAASVDARLPAVGKLKASTWLDKHRAVEQMTWVPGEPIEIKDRLISNGGWIPREGCRVFSLYRAPVVKPVAGDVAPWLHHVERLYGEDAAHVVKWCAHRVQRPHEKINHALVLGGKQGIGKDTLLEPVKYAVGAWNFTEVSPQQVLGRFNGFLKSVILRVSEARDLGEFDRFAFYDHMKNITAAPPDVLRIDEKNRQEYAIPNVCGVVITTNHKSDGIYLPADDRRHFVAWSDLDKDAFAPTYWTGLWQWFERDGFDAVTHFLQNLDLADFKPKAPPPQTSAFFEIINASRTPENAELADALDRLAWPEAVTIDAIIGAATPDFANYLKERKNNRSIPHRFEECGYTSVQNPDAKDGMWRLHSRRQVIYVRNTLSLRGRLDAARAL